MEEKPFPLRRENLRNSQALAAVGILVVKALLENGIASLFINADGEVEVILPGELECDGLEEGEAIRVLTAKGYSDQQMVAYLKGRDARIKMRA